MTATSTLTVEARGEREIVMVREFSAPRQLIFDCWSKPELLKRWFGGPREWSLIVCEVDFRVGGKYRFVTKNANNGEEMGWGGEYTEIDPPERFVATELFDEAWYEGESLNTTILEEHGGRTVMTMVGQYASRSVRDEVMKSGMESGLSVTFDRLEELLPELEAVR
jgi:uncharacterized protein YndB with AHSA1/START domain